MMGKVLKKLNFGSGFDNKKGWDNVDKNDFDFNKFPYPIKNNTYDYVYSRNVFEHVFDAMETLKELIRITKPKGTIEIIVPHYRNKSAYSSLDHQRAINEDAFQEFINYNPDLVEIESLELVPTWIGRLFIFEWVRKKLDLFFSSLYAEVNCKYRVLKQSTPNYLL